MRVDFIGTPLFRKRESDAGFDITCSEDTPISFDGFTKVPTGTRVCIPEGYYGQITHRSSALQRGIMVMDGTIDAGYTGELHILAKMIGTPPPGIIVKKGERIAQIIFLPIPRVTMCEVDAFTEMRVLRGEEGWGSSGR